MSEISEATLALYNIDTLAEIDFNKFLDLDIDSVTKELEEILADTKYKIYYKKFSRQGVWFGSIFNVHNVCGKVAKIEYNYGVFHKKKSFVSNNYILFDEIAQKYRIFGAQYLVMMKNMTLRDVKSNIKTILDNEITLNDVIHKKILTDEDFTCLFDYMKTKISECESLLDKDRVELSSIDLTQYIGKDVDYVILELRNKLVKKYDIHDCRYGRFLVEDAYSVDIYSDSTDKVCKINFTDMYIDGQVTKRGYIKRFMPNEKTLQKYFDLPIGEVLEEIRDTIDVRFGAGDCRKKINFFGFNTYGLIVFCSGDEKVKLIKYTDCEGIHTIHKLDEFGNKIIRDKKTTKEISFDKYIGKNVNDVFIEFHEILDDKYKIFNSKHSRDLVKELDIIIYSHDDIVKLIKYCEEGNIINVFDKTHLLADNTQINIHEWIGKNKNDTIIELTEKLGNIENIKIDYKLIENTGEYDSIVKTIEYI